MLVEVPAPPVVAYSVEVYVGLYSCTVAVYWVTVNATSNTRAVDVTKMIWLHPPQLSFLQTSFAGLQYECPSSQFGVQSDPVTHHHAPLSLQQTALHREGKIVRDARRLVSNIA